ncbi:hypothetical protein VNO80_15492 [Phaseolus coccineus]|uniref:Uncharacterized protein n=1 Tax=Phaseolus coccineus TaxID=3886 RepID=A0AAN9R304_PHACN
MSAGIELELERKKLRHWRVSGTVSPLPNSDSFIAAILWCPLHLPLLFPFLLFPQLPRSAPFPANNLFSHSA